MKNRKTITSYFLLILTALFLSSRAFALDYIWLGVNGDVWNDSSKWREGESNNGIPGAGDGAFCQGILGDGPTINSAVNVDTVIISIWSADGDLKVNSGGDLTANEIRVGFQDNEGELVINGGSVRVNTILRVPYDPVDDIGRVYLNSGTLDVASFWIQDTGSGSIDIEEGVFLLDGDQSDLITPHIDAGRITAYNGQAGYALNMDYNVSNAGRTTVNAVAVTLGADDFDNGAAEDNYWSTAENWVSDTVPTSTSTPAINYAYECKVNSMGNVADNLIIFDGGKLKVSSGRLDVASDLTVGIWDLSASVTPSAELTVEGGTLGISGLIRVAPDAADSGKIYLRGGRLEAAGLEMYSATQSYMDITEGVLILDGDDSVTVQSYIDNGYIVAYGGNSTLIVDYNVTNPGKTTVKANAVTDIWIYWNDDGGDSFWDNELNWKNSLGVYELPTSSRSASLNTVTPVILRTDERLSWLAMGSWGNVDTELTVESSASLTASGVSIGQNGSYPTLNMNGGLITADIVSLPGDAFSGVDVNFDSVNGGRIVARTATILDGAGLVINGGSFEAAELDMSGGYIELNGGVLILDGDQRALVQGLIDNFNIDVGVDHSFLMVEYSDGKTVISAVPAPDLSAGDFDNDAGDNLWGEPMNWEPDTEPTSLTSHLIHYGYSVELQSAGEEASELFIKNGATLNMTNGSFSCPGFAVGIGDVGAPGVGTFNLSGGTFTGGMVIGQGSGGNGVVNISGSAVYNADGWNIMSQADGAIAMLNISDTARLNATGAGVFVIGEYGQAAVVASGNAVIDSVKDIRLGLYAGGSGSLFIHDSAYVKSSGYIQVGPDADGTGQIFLLGGTLEAAGLFMYSGQQSYIDIAGGTLVLDGDQQTTVNSYINDGWIVGYSRASTLTVDYNNVNPGKTTVTAAVPSNAWSLYYGTEFNGPHNMPGVIEAEDFNNGGSGVAYLGQTAGNQGNSSYRNSDIDVNEDLPRIFTTSSASTPCYEYVSYSFNIGISGWYKIGYITKSAAGSIRTLLNDHVLDYSPTYLPVDSFGYSTGAERVYLSAGRHHLSLAFEFSDVSVDSIIIKRIDAPPFNEKLIDTGEEMVMAVDVTDAPYNADNTGTVDSTAQIQQALDDVSSLGGGTVFIPEGKYKVGGYIGVPGRVTLMGSWQNPLEGGSGQGTILMAYAGRNDESGKAFITLSEGVGHALAAYSVVKNISIWYPEQSPDNIVPYPYSIATASTWVVGAMVENITLYNSYNGVNILAATNANIRELYGVALKNGITTAYGGGGHAYISDVNIGNSFWINVGSELINNSPFSDADIASLNLFTIQNSDALIMGRNDGCFINNITVRDCNRGIVFEKQPGDTVSFYGQLANIDAEVYRVGNQYEGISNLKTIDITDVPEVSGRICNFASLRKPAVTLAESLYNVRDYGARGDGSRDDTDAIQAALDAAGVAGGGTVYLPAGAYNVVTNLNIPSGVEMLGASNSFVDPASATTALRAFQGRGTSTPDSDTAFITVNQDAGIRSFGIHHPEQTFAGASPAFTAYPYAVRGNGSGIWIRSISFLNAYNGIDLNTNKCDNFHLFQIGGSRFNIGVYIGGGSVGGDLEDVGGTYLQEHVSASKNASRYAYQTQDALVDYSLSNTKVLILGDCQNIKIFKVGSFVAKYLLKSNHDSFANCDIWFPQSDTNENEGFIFNNGNSEINIFAAAGKGGELAPEWLKTGAAFTGTVNVYGRKNWGGTGRAAINGGTVNIKDEESLVTAKVISGGASNAIDRDINTDWAGSSFVVDLGQPSDISQWLLIKPVSGYTTNATLEYSMDGSSYSEAAVDATSHLYPSSMFGADADNPETYRARYVRLTLGNGSISDLAVFGKPGWQFTDPDNNNENWTAGGAHVSSMDVVDGKLLLTSSGNDPVIVSANNLNIDLDGPVDEYIGVRVRMLNEISSTSAQVFFTTNADGSTTEAKSAVVSILPNNSKYQDVYFNFAGNAAWTGTLKQLRFDPGTEAGEIRIDSIELIQDDVYWTNPDFNKVAYNGTEYSHDLNTEVLDPQGDAITFSVHNGTLPSWMTLSAGVLSGIPAAEDVGTGAQFTLKADDLDGHVAYAKYSVSVIMGDDPYILWEVANGIENDGPDGDFDGDGYTNMHEYLFGMSPIDSSNSRLPIAGTDSNAPTIKYSYRTDSPEKYTVETSLTLASGSWGPASVTELSNIDNGDGTSTRELRSNVSYDDQSKQFFRVEGNE